ncbi:MAG TPA: DnaJ domain-containing protein [Xanthobacteraceae bacterium]|nr:DnaJ domain-containing protein [Xanthobacteraceae bacterium]
MGDPLLLAAVTGLGLSTLVSAIRLIDWFLHSDPKVIAQTGRWAALGLAAMSIPLLFGLLLTQRWTAAIGLTAVMLLGFAFYGPRLLRTLMPRRLVPDWSPPKGTAAASGRADISDPELVQRSIAVLEEYLRCTTGIPKPDKTNGQAMEAPGHGSGHGHTGNGRDRDPVPAVMSEAEAFDILGLDPDAAASDIGDAHRRLLQLVHPDHRGSHYLAVKINQAKDVLLDTSGARKGQSEAAPARKRPRRRPPRPPP